MKRTKVKAEQERRVYDFIKVFCENNGFPPTYRDMAKEWGCSTSTVFRILHNLREKGFVDFQDDKNRTLKIIKEM